MHGTERVLKDGDGTLEQRQGLKIACIEEIAFSKGFIGAEQLERLAHACGNGDYGRYLQRVLREHRAGMVAEQ